SVAAQPLSESLRSLAKQANLQILFDSAIVAGKPGRALNGAESPRKALTDLLRGTGLEAVEQAPGVIVIRRRSAKGEISRGESFE
ncbi:STN domain-containing protein, partial [Vibrio parahaemolyticus]